jgi:anti-sigma-K factor RskA
MNEKCAITEEMQPEAIDARSRESDKQPSHAMKFIRAQAATRAVAASILVVGYF